jgi:hypothetical protein
MDTERRGRFQGELPRAKLALACAAFAVCVAGCTASDGEPWGWVEAEQTIARPGVAADFEVESYRVEIATVRLVETVTGEASAGSGTFDPQNPPPGCSLCHNGHCHCDGDLVDYEDLRQQASSGGGTSRSVLANFTYDEPIESPQPRDLGRVGVGAQTTIDTVEVELAAVRVDGVWRDGDSRVPMTLSLPGIAGTRLSAAVAVDIGPDAPERQRLELSLRWPEDWFATIEIANLDKQIDGSIELSSISNRSAATSVVGVIADESSLEAEVVAP